MKRLIILLLTISFLQLSCKKDDWYNCFENTGATTTEERHASPFIYLEMFDNVNVIYNPDTIFAIKVTGGVNIIDGLTTEIVGDRLYIRNINKCNWLRDFRNEFTVEINGNSLRQIIVSGSGDLKFTDTLKTEKLRIESWEGTGKLEIILDSKEVETVINSGPIDIYLSGRTTLSYSYSGGNGYIFARNFQSEYNYSTNKGTGDFHLQVQNELDVNIEHSGDVYYHGEPYSIKKQITGTGNLYKSD
jgi:putative autotransporter adhesin-like protein